MLIDFDVPIGPHESRSENQGNKNIKDNDAKGNSKSMNNHLRSRLVVLAVLVMVSNLQ